MANNSPKTAFYISLWNDYKNKQKEERIENSFIYKYLKQRKDEQAERITEKRRDKLKSATRTDVYVYIQSLFNGYKKKQINENDLLTALEKLINEKSNLKSFSDDINKAGKDRSILKILHNKLLDRCLRKDIQVFFNDIGYVEKMNAGEFPSEIKTRKNNEILDLYFSFVSENEWGMDAIKNSFTSATSKDNVTSKKYIADCKKLLNDLSKEKYGCRAFVPLFIDEGLGIGIFIIGREQLGINATEYHRSSDGKVSATKNPTCALYLACFDDIFAGAYSVDDIEKNVYASFETSFEIIDTGSGDEIDKLINKYNGMITVGSSYDRFPQNPNRKMIGIGKNNPRFKKYFVSRIEEEKTSKAREITRSNIVKCREDQIFMHSKQ